METAFEQAAIALIAVSADPERITAEEMVEVSCQAPDHELLLVDWLNALVYEMATRRIIFGRFQVRISDCHLHGKAWGERIKPALHELAVEVKGATFTELLVQKTEDGRWIAQCVVDV